VFERDGDDEILHDLGDDFVFEVFWVLECEGVVFVHHDGDVVLVPDVEHGAVYDVGEAALRIVRDRFSEHIRVISTTEEPPFTSSEANKETCSTESGIDRLLPLLVSRKSSKVFWLEGDDDVDGESIVFGKGVCSSSIGTGVSKLFGNLSVTVMAIERTSREFFISLVITSPFESIGS
jgi:hypothetical protein